MAIVNTHQIFKNFETATAAALQLASKFLFISVSKTHSVRWAVIGFYFTTNQPPDTAIVNEIATMDVTKVTTNARMTAEKALTLLKSLAAVLQWIRANMQDGDDKVFSFANGVASLDFRDQKNR